MKINSISLDCCFVAVLADSSDFWRSSFQNESEHAAYNALHSSLDEVSCCRVFLFSTFRTRLMIQWWMRPLRCLHGIHSASVLNHWFRHLVIHLLRILPYYWSPCNFHLRSHWTWHQLIQRSLKLLCQRCTCWGCRINADSPSNEPSEKQVDRAILEFQMQAL